jgi:homoserine kinase
MDGRRLEVHKFGGTSLGDAERIAGAAALVAAASADAALVVVASAMAGATDALLEAGAAAAAGERQRAARHLDELARRHLASVAALAAAGAARPLRAELATILDEARDLLRAAALVGELEPRARDRLLAAGEKLSVRLLVAVLSRQGVAARAFDADSFLETDGRRGEARPLHGVSEPLAAAALRPGLERGEVPVVTGFVGRGPDGETTTLGRGGSDLTATLLGAALAAARVVIWTDVDGVFTADPRVVPEARRLPRLHYREAEELALAGAKVLHPATIRPAAGGGIPVEIRNSFRPQTPGTEVDGRAFGNGAGVAPAVKAVSALPSRSELAGELLPGGRPEAGRIAAVGLGMASAPGIEARLVTALARRGVAVAALSRGSDASLSVEVAPEAVAEAVRAIHAEFGLGGDASRRRAPAQRRSAGSRPAARAFAPASCSNLGAGFDLLGLALAGCGDTVTARRVARPGVRLAGIRGDGGRLPRAAAANSAGVAAAAVLRASGVAPEEIGVELRLEKGTPIASGLGSSAASAAAAAAAVNALLGGPLAPRDLVAACLEAEAAVSGRHADNAAAAVLGGLVLVRSLEPLEVVRLPVPRGLWIVLATPDFPLPTRQARAALPACVSLAERVAAAADVGAFVAACHAGDLGLLARAVRDDQVARARAALIPGSGAALAAARGAGALAASVAGAGPSLFAFAHSAGAARRAGDAMAAAFAAAGHRAAVLVSPADCPGARPV